MVGKVEAMPSLDQVHKGHDDRRLRQFDPEFFHDWSEISQERIESLLALPNIEYLQLTVFAKA